MQPNHYRVRLRGKKESIVQRCATCGSFSFGAVTRSGIIHENATHDSRAHGKKVSSILPLNLPYVDQPKIRFMHQGSGLNGVIRDAPGSSIGARCHAAPDTRV